MGIEIIMQEPVGSPFQTPILFVHGAWHGAWCWDEHFLPYFAKHGFTSYALSLRGHGHSHGNEKLRWTSIADYVSDVAQVVKQLPVTPVLVGHSMGGLVVQKFLETHQAPAAVLLASVPITGVLRTALRILARHPIAFLKANLILGLYPIVGKPKLTRELFFSEDISEEKLKHYFKQIRDESYRAFLDMLIFALPKPQKIKTDMLVLGAENDKIFLPDQVETTAKTYNTNHKLWPGMAHDMMLEKNWQSVADYIIDWLRSKNL